VRTVRTPTAEDVVAAREVVSRHLTPTPVVASPPLGRDVLLKLETLQPTGSFKVRGGLAAVKAALHEDRNAELVAASAGNHGLGVAYAARTFGATATIVVPETTSAAKLDALARFDVTVLPKGAEYDDAEAYGVALANERGARYVSPYNDPDTIAGQGTIALELFEQASDVRTIVVPVGGGGLIAGVALAAALQHDVKVVGVDAAASPAVAAELQGKPTPIDVHPTLADGLAGNVEPGSVTIDLVRRLVDGIVSVDEDQIADGMRFLAREHGVVVEGSGAVGVAALLHGLLRPDRGPTAVLVTGRNVSPALFARVINGAAR
jgi:threonine dehydratase